MTIASEDARSGPYNGNGSTTVFAYDFKALDQAHLVVTLKNSLGVETVQTITTHYSVSGVGDEGGGNVTMVTAPASGQTLTITRSVPLTQGVDLQNRGGVQPNTLETAYDRLTQISQDTREVQQRTVKFPVSSLLSGIEMPGTATSNAVISWNSSGTALVNGPTSTEISNAESNATAAAASASAASASATLASQWATKTDGQVASTDYASKAWAIGGTGVTDTASAGAAKEWATEAEDNTVDGTEYSAKHYSAKASAQATAAAASAAAAAAAASGNLYGTVTTLTTGTTDVEIANNGTYYLCDTSGGNITINLPAIGTDEGTRFGFQKVGASNSVSFVRDGTDTINGGTSYTLTQDTEVVLLIADDNTPDNWIATIQSQTLADETTITKTGSTFEVKDDGITPAKIQGGVNAQSGTSYTLVIGDAFKTVTMSNSSANTLTIPTNASVAFSVGDRIDVVMLGAGTTTITGASGVTLNGVASPTTGGAIAAQYAAASCLKIATDTWLLIGNHGGVS